MRFLCTKFLNFAAAKRKREYDTERRDCKKKDIRGYRPPRCW